MNARLVLTIFATVLLGGTTSGFGQDNAWKANLESEAVTQMEVALQRGEAKAKRCFEVVPGVVRGKVSISVVFDGKIGRISNAATLAPYAGSSIALCFERAFVGEIVPPFAGAPRTVAVVFEPPT